MWDLLEMGGGEMEAAAGVLLLTGEKTERIDLDE